MPTVNLSDLEKRAIVRESIDFLIQKGSFHPEPNNIRKLAEAVAKLFPQLKTNNIENNGIVINFQIREKNYLFYCNFIYFFCTGFIIRPTKKSRIDSFPAK